MRNIDLISGWCVLFAVASLAVEKVIKGGTFGWDWLVATLLFSAYGVLALRRGWENAAKLKEKSVFVQVGWFVWWQYEEAGPRFRDLHPLHPKGSLCTDWHTGEWADAEGEKYLMLLAEDIKKNGKFGYDIHSAGYEAAYASEEGPTWSGSSTKTTTEAPSAPTS